MISKQVIYGYLWLLYTNRDCFLENEHFMEIMWESDEDYWRIIWENAGYATPDSISPAHQEVTQLRRRQVQSQAALRRGEEAKGAEDQTKQLLQITMESHRIHNDLMEIHNDSMG